MKSFLLACLAIIVIGISASYVTDRYDPSASDRVSGVAVRLD